MRRQLSILAMVAVGCAVMSAPMRAEIIEQVLVKVNGDIITKGDFERMQVDFLRQRQDLQNVSADSPEVKKAVANMVRMTSKFVYVTTRYHPNPADLLDFNQKDDLDPTHITLLNKDLLRLMFVLEGCRSRPSKASTILRQVASCRT